MKSPFLSTVPDSKTEHEIAAAMEAYRRAFVMRDAPALAEILHDDLKYSHSTNLHQSKADVLATLADSLVAGIEFQSLAIRVYGDAATVACDAGFTNQNAAGEVTLVKLNVLHVLVRTPRGWQMVARQATRYPDPASR